MKKHIPIGFKNGQRVIIVNWYGKSLHGKISYQRDENGKKVFSNGETIYVQRDGYVGDIGIGKNSIYKLIIEP